MKRIQGIIQHYISLTAKLGIVRFSLLFTVLLLLLAFIIQMGASLLFPCQVDDPHLLRSIFFSLLLALCAIYFFSIVVREIEQPRQKLAQLIQQLEEFRVHDLDLNKRLQKNIWQLNQEIEERKKAELARQQAFEDLKNEIRQRELIQIDLARKGALLRSFIDASPDLVYYCNEQHQFFSCNRAVELLLGKSELQIIGLTPWHVYPVEVAQRIVETDRTVFKKNSAITYEQWLNYPDGRKACFEIRKVPFYDQNSGCQKGLMGFGRDITERKDYQDALERASQEKTQFIATISHELRTPLNGIVGLSRMLMDTHLNKKQERYLKTIYLSAITLGNIFNDIIILDKISYQNIQLVPTPLLLNDFMIELTDLGKLLVEGKDVSFTLNIPNHLPHNVLVDGTRLRQILWNLISNAAKFTQKGHICISVLYQVKPKPLLTFQVKDTGLGISATEQEKIFQMYYQVQGAPQEKQLNPTGSGIGLAISQQLALMMGGEITVKSELGQGSCFSLCIAAPALEKQNPTTHIASQQHYSCKILLVEDIELNITVACALLKKLGHYIDVAKNGTQALALFKPGKYHFIFLDIQLPDMSGFDVVKVLRENYNRGEIPTLVALTANITQNRSYYLAKGIDDVLAKPLSISALEGMIDYYQGKKSMTSIERTIGTVLPKKEPLLDVERLEQYISLLGVPFVLENLSLFNTSFPGYLLALRDSYVQNDAIQVAKEAHKIKNASGSICLKRLYRLAGKIEKNSSSAFWKEIATWIKMLEKHWEKDVQFLHHYLIKKMPTQKSVEELPLK